MKTFQDQVVEDETLMEFADGTLPKDVTHRITRMIANSEADMKVLSDFQASGRLIQLLRVGIKKYG